MTKWGSPGTVNGQFRVAGGIGAIGQGDGQLNHVHDIAVYPCGNNLYITDRDNNRIQMFDNNGKFLRKWGTNGSAIGQFHYPEGIGVDSRQDT